MTGAASDTTPVVPPRELTIRKARPNDVDVVAAIERRAFSDPWSANSFRALFGNPLVHFAVAEDTGAARVVG
jgi:ribosomal protein S18 acetylase RimI-like enzyme